MDKKYTIAEAAAKLPELSTSKFVGSVDVDIILVPTKKKNQSAIRGSVTFPNPFGEEKKVIVFGDEQVAKKALAAGAIAAGLDDLISDVEKGKVEFDAVIATPDVMGKIAKLGRVLGPKGLMPNPGNGTVTTDVEATVKSYISGKQDFKVSEQQAVRGRVAKLDMTPEQIAANIEAFLAAVLQQAKSLDPNPFKKITLSPTMGKGVQLDVATVMEQLG